MKSRDFCFWLQGYFELTNENSLGPSSIACIKKHLSLVFKHEIDPSIDGGDPVKKQELNDLHKKNSILRC